MTAPVIAQEPPEAAETRICIAPMRRRHLRSVLTTEAKVYPKPWSLSLFTSELAQPGNRRYLIARSGAVVVGHAGVMFIVDEGHVTTIAVDPPWQGRQIATRLLLELVRKSIEYGAVALTLEVRASNRRAQRLYSRFGFAPAGIRKGYYADSGEDAIIMWLQDIDSESMVERLARIEAAIEGETSYERPDDGD